MIPPRIHHGAALVHAKRILAASYSPASQIVRIARAYVDLHDKSTRVLNEALGKVDAALELASQDLARDAGDGGAT